MKFLDVLTSLGPEAIRLLSSGQEPISKENIISSGILAVDAASGIGGLPRNRIIEIFSEEGAGKTTVALHICAQYNKMGLAAAYIDVEHAMDLGYAFKIGVKKNLFALAQPQSGEEAWKIAIEMARAEDIGIIVMDSVAALMTEQELEGELTDANIGATARLMGRGLRKLVPICSVNGTMGLFINQNRDKIGVMWGNPVTQPGGRALRYAATMRISLARVSTNKTDNIAVSNETKFTFIKNKLAPPQTQGTFNILFGKGADNLETLIDFAVKKNILEKKGSWFSYQGGHVAQGKKDLKAWLRDKANRSIRETIWEEITEKHNPTRNLSVTEKDSKPLPNMPRVLEG